MVPSTKFLPNFVLEMEVLVLFKNPKRLQISSSFFFFFSSTQAPGTEV